MSLYSLILSLHISAFVWSIFFVIIADVLALLWVLGKKPTLPARTMHRLHYLVAFGLTVSVFSGAYMFSTVSGYLLTVPAFYSKMLFVAGLIINSVVIAKHIPVATVTTFSALPLRKKMPLLISGAVSTLCWVGAFVSAQLLGL